MPDRDGRIAVAFPLFDSPGNACPTIRVLSPLGKLPHAIRLDLPVSKDAYAWRLDKERLYAADVVLIQRTSFLHRPISEIRSRFRKVIYEIDDNLLEVPASNPSRSASMKFRDRIIAALQEADAVTVSTEALRDKLSRYGGRFHVLPNRIDLDIWGVEPREPDPDRQEVSIGFVGTPTHQEDLRIVTPAVRRIIRKFGKRVAFRFFGCITEELRKLPRVEFVSSLILDYALFARRLKKLDIDIALAPLLKNSFNECKSNIKFLEYSVCGIPGIYSRITPYSASVSDGVTGLLCGESEEEWYRAIGTLIEEKEFRRRLAREAHREVTANYSLRDHSGDWEAVYRSVTGKGESLVSLETAKTGLPTMKVVADGGSTRLLHSLYDPEAEARTAVESFRSDEREQIVVLGFGLGYHVAALRRVHPRAPITVIEQLPETLRVAGECGRLAAMGEGADFIVGYPPKEAIGEITRRRTAAGYPPLAVFPHAPSVAAFPGYYVSVLEALSCSAAVNLGDRLRYPKFQGDVLTVALFDFGYFLTEEIARAVKALGHSVVRVRGRKDESCGDILGRAVETIATHKPDFFLTVNHLGFDEDGALTDLFWAIEMPAAIWYVDSPNLVVRAFPKNISPFTSIFVWDDGYLDTMKSLGFENVSYLPLGVDETVFRPKSLSSPERKRMGTDLGFVGNSMVGPARDQLAKVPRELHAAVERTAKRLDIARTVPYEEAARESMNSDERAVFESLRESDNSGFEAAVLWRATLLYRLSCLHALEEFHPCIRGDEGWKKLVNGKFRLGPQLNYYKELPSFYNACTVNFNATSIQMGKAVNQRVFDVPACGAFLLTDHQASIEGLFEVGKEVVTYKDRGEIADLARFYLRNDAARRTITGKGKERVLAEHTYRHRIETITRRLREVYG
jgi:spore maturation protein CgeB